MTEKRTGLDDGPQLPRNPSRPPAHTFTHTYSILEVSADAYREIRLRLEDSAHGDRAVLERLHRVHLDRDEKDGIELLVFGPVALKAQPQVHSTTRQLDQRTQQLDVLLREVRALVDELKGQPFPPMILENDRIESGGAGRKCGDCGHVFERGEKSFEGARCETCAKVELEHRVALDHKRRMNLAEIAGSRPNFTRV